MGACSTGQSSEVAICHKTALIEVLNFSSVELMMLEIILEKFEIKKWYVY